MFARVAILVSLAASSMATVFLTSPVAGTTCSGGSSCTISWQDDGSAPSLDTFGDSMVSIYVGSKTQQTMVQNITGSVNVATTSTISFTVDPSVGPNSGVYFVRFESVSGKNGSDPFEAFSAKFTLNNMSGTFNSTVQAQIDAAGDSSASGSATGTGSATSTSASSSKAASSTSSKASSSSSSAASSSSASSAAGRTGVAGGVVGAGVLAALFSLTL